MHDVKGDNAELPEEDLVASGEALYQARIAAGFSQKQLAHFAGTSETTIHFVERGERSVRPHMWVQFSRVLRVPVEKLYIKFDE